MTLRTEADLAAPQSAGGAIADWLMTGLVPAKAGPIGLDAHGLSMSSRIGSPARAVRDDNRNASTKPNG